MVTGRQMEHLVISLDLGLSQGLKVDLSLRLIIQRA